jgi:hypothetical protein
MKRNTIHPYPQTSTFNDTDISEAHGTTLGVLFTQTTKNVYVIMDTWVLHL